MTYENFFFLMKFCAFFSLLASATGVYEEQVFGKGRVWLQVIYGVVAFCSAIALMTPYNP